MRVRFLSVAQREVDDVVAWYEAQSENLGREFLDEMDRAVRLIKRYSQMAPEIEPDLRRVLLTRFPYSLIYGID